MTFVGEMPIVTAKHAQVKAIQLLREGFAPDRIVESRQGRCREPSLRWFRAA